jgi:NAD(P)-dependent dehydrogenase (short-subunit alcohol dehydrogenase family)
MKGRTVAITGGASGLGMACTRRFLEAGANVLIMDVNQEAGNNFLKELGQPDRVLFAVTDVTSEGAYLSNM